MRYISDTTRTAAAAIYGVTTFHNPGTRHQVRALYPTPDTRFRLAIAACDTEVITFTGGTLGTDLPTCPNCQAITHP